MPKEWIDKMKLVLQQHFKVDHLLYKLAHLLKINLIVGIDHFETKNPKRFKLCLINYILSWIVILWHIIFLSSNLYSLIDGPFLPDGFNLVLTMATLALIHSLFMKTDILLGQIKSNLRPFQFSYYLAKNIKSKHELTEKNYNRLAIFFRINFIGSVYYGFPIISSAAIALSLVILIKIQKLYWLFHVIFITPFYINSIMLISTGATISNCMLIYYKMRFDQLHHQIKSIMPKGEVIIKSRGKMLKNIIYKHNKLAIEVHEMNLMVRRTVAGLFINLTIIKIISLHLMFTTKDFFIKSLAINVFLVVSLFCMAISFLLSQQIQSAHQSLQLMHFVVCKYKMKIIFKLKANFYF